MEIFLLYHTDNWQLLNSYRLQGVYTTFELAYKASLSNYYAEEVKNEQSKFVIEKTNLNTDNKQKQVWHSDMEAPF